MDSVNKMVKGLCDIFDCWPRLYENSLYIQEYRAFLNTSIQSNYRNNHECHEINAIEMKGITFSYDEKIILRDINLKIEKGEFIGLVGSNGTGKSTLIKILSGLYQPKEGEILINGVPMFQYVESDIRKRIHIVFQDYAMFALSIAENILMHEIQEMEDGISFSGGEFQRLAIARMFAANSEVVIMDEIFSSVDALTREMIIQYINENRRDKIYILITHQKEDLHMADRVYQLTDGKIYEIETV